ncbi:stromal interaction molecule homolog isoform X2 [Daphnia pulicaria]|uniref:stromal interaction molecule homolog isoform X2 n=1 Tax=Daphnia pulicaria TaxID=35523 RepID=UPI001EECDC9F|nr:stromal interaction molecule homolog isoform X2 [Daphnia pulicaria]
MGKTHVRFSLIECFTNIFCIVSLINSGVQSDITYPSRPDSSVKKVKNDVITVPLAANIWKPYTQGNSQATPCFDEYSCLAARLSDAERLNLEAIRTLHGKLDDDANGNIDLSESDEFLREELHYEGGHERRQKAFHRDDDMHISVRELWDIWTRSEVHNWTIEQTTEWLSHFVQLPQYVSQFQQHNIDGTKLPRLAVNNVLYISGVLGIKDPIHRQKIAVKAMDVVLFGTPKDSSNYVKDVTLITLLVLALAGALYTYKSNRHSKQHLNKLMEHMEILSSAEKELQELQVKLQHARQEQDITLSEKQQLERKLEEEVRGSNASLYQPDPLAELELRRLREEVDILRGELQRAEGELEDRLCWTPPADLQHWLQLTYELEQRVYNKKRLQAEKQLEQAKDACEKLNRKRSSFVASFVSTHGRAIDDVDKSILEARSSLMEVKQDLQERTTRWRQIESLCGFSISTNPGLSYLETLLRSGLNSSRFVVFNPSRHGGTFEEDIDETGSMVSSCAALKQLVSTSTVVFLSSAAGSPTATAAALLPFSDGRNNATGNRPGQHFHNRKYPLLKRDSSVSLESASALINSYGNGLSSHSVSLSELPKTPTVSVPAVSGDVVIRQRLKHREDSKDSAFDGSIVSVGTNAEDDVTIPSRAVALSNVTQSKPISLPKIESSPGAVPKTLPILEKPAVVAPSQNVENVGKSPLLPTKLNTRTSFPTKAFSQDIHDPTPVFKTSHSESALDVTYQNAMAQQVEAESGQEENVSTDSSLPSNDEESRKLKKKQRFQFPSFVKRNKNKT